MHLLHHLTYLRRSVARLLLFGLSVSLSGAVFHVASNGNDKNPGWDRRPLASLSGARDAVRASGLLGREPIQVIFRAGVYYLPEAVVSMHGGDGGSPQSDL